MTYTFIGDPQTVRQYPELEGQRCEIVRALPDPADDHPTVDMYLVSFPDSGQQVEVHPEELDPIPTPGVGR